LSPHLDGGRFCRLGFPVTGGCLVVTGRCDIRWQDNACLPVACRLDLSRCLAFPATVAAGAVHRAGVDRDAIAAIHRDHGHAAEGIDPSPGDAGVAKPSRDAFQRRGALAQRRHKGFPEIVVGLRHRIRRVQHDFVEPDLVAFQERPGGRRRL
jgi:hypothetical protein